MEFRVEGERIFAASGGRNPVPGQAAVVFIHGAGMDHSVWSLQTRYFAHHGFNAIAPDLPGHGMSGGAPLDSIDAMAAWLAAALEALEARDAVLVGHSMGAIVCLVHALRSRPGPRALALLGCASSMPVHPDLLAAAEADDPLAAGFITSWGYGAAGRIGGSRAPGIWLRGTGRRLLERARPGVLFKDLAACAAFTGEPEALGGLDCPTLVVVGRDDLMTPAKAGRKLAAAIPGAQVHEIADCGHMMMVERPDETLDALIAFLADRAGP